MCLPEEWCGALPVATMPSWHCSWTGGICCGCLGKTCRYLYVGTSSGTLLVIDQEPGEGKMLRLVQMTPRVTANRGLFSRPCALCSPPHACSPLALPRKLRLSPFR